MITAANIGIANTMAFHNYIMMLVLHSTTYVPNHAPTNSEHNNPSFFKPAPTALLNNSRGLIHPGAYLLLFLGLITFNYCQISVIHYLRDCVDWAYVIISNGTKIN